MRRRLMRWLMRHVSRIWSIMGALARAIRAPSARAAGKLIAGELDKLSPLAAAIAAARGSDRMKIFVTGASGYIGSAVAGACARRGHQVIGLVRTAAKASGVAAAEVEPVIGSMDAQEGWLPRAKECAALVHCAAEYTQRYME